MSAPRIPVAEEDGDLAPVMIGSSRPFLSVLDTVDRVAQTDATILILGETGTGKELLAKTIHLRSARKDRQFVTINCGAIPRELLESELFGYVKGAFTGAIAHKKGKVEMADGGTLFLDEIGEMPLDLQVRILRLIQERETEKVGATFATKVDVRLIAATHRDLAAMVEKGGFREDLYYRLLVVPINLPPLRERIGDFPELLQYFLEKYKRKYRLPELTFRADTLSYFANYSWPGNIRQLENTMERLVLLSNASEITPAELPAFLRPTEEPVHQEGGVSLASIEKETILQALQKFGGNRTRAAQYLGISRRALSYRLEKHGLNIILETPEPSNDGAVPKRSRRHVVSAHK
ncbi:MAG TPA: sigma 54-interacting transcriptional regulator [Bryobacteraceae bacterium]|nr:sigma 54-interacting transcriptional regulator [Bryobacteraceae bacterium]